MQRGVGIENYVDSSSEDDGSFVMVNAHVLKNIESDQTEF